jgi:sugar fermentation stimulation protein A
MAAFVIPNTFYRSLIEATFDQRPHRFGANVIMDQKLEMVHVPNSGRLKELLYPGNPVLLHDEGHPGRKTRFTIVGAKVMGGWAFIDSRLPNHILKDYWRQIPVLAEYEDAWPEVGFGNSRFDLALQKNGEELTLVEAKCVTLVRDGCGRFPDAPTERGQRHLLELAKAVHLGHRSMVIFFLQHPGGRKTAANEVTDPRFAQLMREVAAQGVEFYGYRVEIKTDHMKVLPIEVVI